MLTRIALALLPIVAVVFLTVLIADIKGWWRTEGESMATLTFVSGTVRRLPKSELGWDYAHVGSGFNEGDAISVGETGMAKLTFKNGNILELSEGSMMVISSGENQKLELRFSTGQAKFHLAKKEFRNMVEVTETRENLNAPKDAPNRAVSVEIDTAQNDVSSEARIVAPKKTSRKKSALTVNSDQVLMTTQLPNAPIVNSPSNGASLFLSTGEPLVLTWTNDSKGATAKSYEIAIRGTNETDPKIYKSEVNSLKIDQLPPGKYVWSVRGVDDHGLRGAASPASHLDLSRIAAEPTPVKAAPLQSTKPIQSTHLTKPDVAAANKAQVAQAKKSEPPAKSILSAPTLSKPVAVGAKTPAEAKVQLAPKPVAAKTVVSLKPTLKAPTLKPMLMIPTTDKRSPAAAKGKAKVVFRAGDTKPKESN